MKLYCKYVEERYWYIKFGHPRLASPCLVLTLGWILIRDQVVHLVMRVVHSPSHVAFPFRVNPCSTQRGPMAHQIQDHELP